MRQFLRTLTNLDARAWRTIAISFLMFGGIGVVFILGAPLLGLNGPAGVERWIGGRVAGPWAPVIAVGSFTLLAFLGAPQFVLIAAAVVAFGSWAGFAYSWLGTEISALVGFWLGRRFGAGLLRDYAGKGTRQFIDLVGRNGLLASLVVRLVPSAPFIVVNMAAGVTSMRWWPFALGTAIGIVPKIAGAAFFGRAVVNLMSGKAKSGNWLSLLLGMAIWIAIGLAARWWLKRREAAADAEAAAGRASIAASDPSTRGPRCRE